MKCFFLSIVLLLSLLTSHAQYQINLSLTNSKDSLAYFRTSTFDEKLFIPKDTAQIIKGKVKFSSSTSVFGGIYYIYLPKSNRKIQLCVENKDIINLKMDAALPFDSIACSDPENKIFIQYQALEHNYQYIDSQYNEILKKGNASLKLKEAMYQPKKDTLSAFRTKALKSLKAGSLLFKYFSWINTLDAYSPNRQAYEGREKFISQFPLQDPQLYFSPLMKEITYEYLSSFPLNADSTLKGINVVMKRLDCKDKAYPNTFNYFSTVLQNGTIKNNLNGYVQFIDAYLINNKCTFLAKGREGDYLAKYKQFKQLAGTDTVINISLKDSSGKIQDLKDQLTKNDFTILSFYDPTCEHCQIQMPDLDLAIKSVINQTGLSILSYAVCNTNMLLEKEWKKFVNEYDLSENFIHVIMGETDKPRIDYAAYGNPMFFLIDKSGTILLKKATVSSIRNYLLAQKKRNN